MRRWTAGLLGIGTLILAGEALLVQRAVEAVDREQAARRAQLAERCHGELARGLADLLAREDARPFTHWRHLYVPDDAVPGLLALAVSPLARPSSDPAIVGWVQIDPDGTLHTPVKPRDEELERLSATWNGDAGLEARLADLLARVEPAAGVMTQVAEPAVQAPTSGYAQVDAYLNRKLNDSGDGRQQAARVVTARADNIGNFSDPAAETFSAQAISVAQLQQQAAPDQAMLACLPTGWTANGDQEVVIGPFRAAPARADSLLLLREVAVAGAVYRQGVVLDTTAVQARLAARLLDDPERPPGLAVRWDGADGVAFPAPFASLTASIDLPEFGNDRRRMVLAVGLGLLAASALALIAALIALRAALRDVRRRQDFVAAVTHELKTPLTAIRLHAEMLRDGLVSDPAKQQAYHATIVAESGRLARLIGNVLDLARLERGERPLSPQLGDPASVLAEAVALIGPHAAAQGFTVAVEAGPEVGTARFDRDALLQVVINLVDNAVKFAADGERSITLAVRRSGDRVRVVVADRGPGVPDGDLRRIFRPFWRGGRELTRRAPGTGIGLALVHSLMQGMGGSVEARNRTEGGLEVICALPAGQPG